MFRNAETCTPYVRTGGSCAEAYFIGLGNSLYGYYQTLQNFENTHRAASYLATTTTPAVVAFIIAYVFGIGCLLTRSTWLREGRNDSHGRLLVDELKKHYNFDDATDEEMLGKEVRAIAGLTPVEALRYEELSIKLMDVIKDKSNPIEEFRAAAPARQDNENAHGSSATNSVRDGGTSASGRDLS